MSTPVTWLLKRSLRAAYPDDETHEWVFDFGDEHVLRVASPWRLRKDGAIALGYEDHGHQFGLPQPLDVAARIRDLVGIRGVMDAAVAEGTADLSIDFGDGVRLEIFNHSAGYEGWILNAPGGRALVAQGGGNLVEWKG